MTRILPNVPTSNLTSILVGGANQMILKGTDKYYRRSSFNLNDILPAYIAVLLICLTGNILVCVTIFRNKKMRKRHYYFLANLSIADIGFALATPGQLINFAQVDTGNFGCKLSIFTVATFYGTALLSLACVNIDRFYGICYSSLFDYEHRVRTMYIIPLVWIAAGMVYTPMLFACEKSHNPHDLTCDCSHSAWPKEKYHTIYEFLIVLATYVIPFSAMMYCHLKMYRALWNKSSAGVVLISTASIRSRKKVVKMLIAATLCFFIAWTPYNVLKILTELNLVGEKLLGKISLVAQVLGFANSACNPFIYCIFSQKFRDGFKEVCCRRKPDVKRNTSAIETKRPREPTTSDTGYGSLDKTGSIDTATLSYSIG